MVLEFRMAVATIRTKAETELIEAFDGVAKSLPGGAAIAALRHAALKRFAAEGLPHRKLEAWKYTDLRARLKYVPPAAPAGKASAKDIAAALGPHLADLPAIRFVFVDGVFVSSSNEDGKGKTWFADPLSKVIGTRGYEWIEHHMAAGDAAPMLALNTAYLTDGLVLRIAEGAKLDLPIHLVFVTTGEAPRSVTTRNLILVCKGASATILESHVALSAVPHLGNAVTQLHAEAGASVDHLLLLAPGAKSTHLGAWITALDARATYRAFQFTQSPGLARHDISVAFDGENASFDYNAAFLGHGDSHIDTTMVIDHKVPRCTSRETLRGVLDGKARGVFQGKVIVRPDAQKSDGKQMAKALLLSPDAEFDSKPELEIYADDVVCGHGSTAAELDEDHVFYLMARGIPRAAARALLTEAFAAETIDAIAHEGLREAFRARLASYLATAHDTAS